MKFLVTPSTKGNDITRYIPILRIQTVGMRPHVVVATKLTGFFSQQVKELPASAKARSTCLQKLLVMVNAITLSSMWSWAVRYCARLHGTIQAVLCPAIPAPLGQPPFVSDGLPAIHAGTTTLPFGLSATQGTPTCHAQLRLLMLGLSTLWTGLLVRMHYITSTYSIIDCLGGCKGEWPKSQEL